MQRIVVARLTAGGEWSKGLFAFLAGFAIIDGSATFLIARRLRRVGEEGHAFRRSLDALPTEDARLEALSVVAGLESSANTGAMPSAGVPAAVAEIFSRYQRIVFPGGDRLELGRSERGFIDVGRSFDGPRLLVRESDGALYA